MKKVYMQTPDGWKLVFTAQSFLHACKIARQMEVETKIPHCVNS